MPEKLLQRLFGRVAQALEQKIKEEHLWCGRHVKVIDGSTVSMPDTQENQKAYPQSPNQGSGCGFPLAKIGALFSLTTGAAVAVIINVLNTADVKLARQLYQFLNPGDVLLGDCGFCSYADLFFIRELGCDAVLRFRHKLASTRTCVARNASLQLPMTGLKSGLNPKLALKVCQLRNSLD